MRILFIVLVGLGLTTLPTPSLAQGQYRWLGDITETERTVLSVLKKAGCDPSWYNQVVRDSSITQTEIRNGLAINRHIYLRSSVNCEAKVPQAPRTPEKEVVVLTPEVLEPQAPTPTTAREPEVAPRPVEVRPQEAPPLVVQERPSTNSGLVINYILVIVISLFVGIGIGALLTRNKMPKPSRSEVRIRSR